LLLTAAAAAAAAMAGAVVTAGAAADVARPQQLLFAVLKFPANQRDGTSPPGCFISWFK